MMQEVNESEWQEILAAPVPVVADFWAPWCGYCKRLEPVAERLAEKYAGALKFVKINVDENAALAQRYAVDTVPTLIAFKDGTACAEIVNPGSQAHAEAWLAESGVL